MARVNLLITNVCNLDCSYCFAKSVKQDNEMIHFMPVEEFDKFLLWCYKLNIVDIGILGGEPTLHPEFETIQKHLKLYMNTTNNGKCVLFTNGTSQCYSWIDYFDGLLINVNSCAKDSVEKSIFEALQSKKFSQFDSFLGYNLYTDTKDYRFFLELLNKYGIKSIRISVSSPMNVATYKEDPKQYYLEMKPIFMQFIKDCYNFNIKLGFDCSQIPLCYFNMNELNLITQLYPNFIEAKKQNHKDCNNVISILPNGICTPCFGHDRFDEICSKKIHFSSVDNLDEFCASFESTRVQKRCQTCKLNNVLCQGTCLSIN